MKLLTAAVFCFKLVSAFRARGAAWLARRPVKPEVAGSNPVGPAILQKSPG